MRDTPLPLVTDLVLIGGGHAHALVLRMWAMHPLPGARLTLINPGPTAPYTGMLPGHVAGHYTRAEMMIDLVRLARFAGARLILDHATGIDRAARRVGTNTSYLSRAINEGLGLNFNEMINRMRAEDVARRIEAEASPNFLQLALEAGFSSKATFNRAFRAVHGVSPSDYRGRLKSQKSEGSPGSEAQPPIVPGT